MTNPEVAEGLEGVVVTQSSICSIVDGVLRYRGYNVDELAAQATFEEVVYLLWHGELPNLDQLRSFKADINKYLTLPPKLFEFLKTLPPQANPMNVLRTAISYLGVLDPYAGVYSLENYQELSKKLLMETAAIVSAWDNVRNGRYAIAAKPNLSFAEKFLYCLNKKVPDAVASEAFNKALILHAEHELNASTFSARVTVATISDMYSGITAAIGTLKGPLHGGANTAVMEMLEKIGNVKNVDKFLEAAFANKEKIMGFGHRVYKNGDPRAKHLKDLSRKLCEMTGNSHLYEISNKLEEQIVSKKGLMPNVDFYSATVYHSLGINKDLFTPIFAVSRISGWIAHILEQYQNNRLIRPRADYTGAADRGFIPIEKR